MNDTLNNKEMQDVMAQEIDVQEDSMKKEVTEAENKKTMKTKNRYYVLLIGLLVSFIATVVIAWWLPSIDGARLVNQASFYDIYNMQSLFDYNFVLYKLLQNTQGDQNIRFDDMFLIDDVSFGEKGGVTKEEISNYANQLKEDYLVRLNSLEQNIKSGNRIESLEYRIVDHSTGKSFENFSLQGENYTEAFLNNYAFYFILSFDEYGKMSIIDLKDANEASLRKDSFRYGAVNAGERFVMQNLSQQYQPYYDVLTEYLSMSPIKNCSIFWGMNEAVWETNWGDGKFNNVLSFYHGIHDLLFGCILVSFAMGMISCLPYHGKKEKVGAFLAPPLIVPFILGTVVSVLYLDNEWIYGFADLYMKTDCKLAYSLELPSSLYHTYGWVLLGLWGYFLVTFYCGMCAGNIFRMGFGEYFERRTILGMIYSKMVSFYENLQTLDLSKSVKKVAVLLVVLNGILVSVFCCGWFVGIIAVIVYSIVLYALIIKYASKVQNNYQKLLKATNAIAEGDLSYKVDENLGVFEPFKPEIYKIEDGFSKAVEEEIKSQKMKSELITNVSHDLKTPLTAIITYINLLQQENISEEERKKYIEVLDTKSAKLKGLIEDLFEVSKANSKNMVLHLQQIDLVSMLKQVQMDYEDKFAEKNLAVRFQFASDKIMAELDSQKTYRIYENLFNNIYKYALAGTRVYVEGKVVDSQIMIAIKNVSAEEITKSGEELTGRFVRGDESRNTEGNGLGLAIVQSFTEAMGGRFVLESDGDLFVAKTFWKNV